MLKVRLVCVVMLVTCSAFPFLDNLRNGTSTSTRHTGKTEDLDFDVINDRLRVEGMPLFQGDMVMTRDMLDAILRDETLKRGIKRRLNRLWQRKDKKGAHDRDKRAAVKSRYRTWGNGSEVEINVEGKRIRAYGVVPFVFDKRLPYWKRTAIEEAINHWETETRFEGWDSNQYCVKFVPYDGSQPNYLTFTDRQGCWSSVGKNILPGSQVVSIGPLCTKMGLIAHELGHALGFFHEQSRPDRDEWIKVIDENVKRSREFNFIKYNTYIIDTRDEDYDYGSIMHYRLNAFSKNGQDTIEPLKETKGQMIGQRERISRGDARQIRKMYGCNNGGLVTEPVASSTAEPKTTTTERLGNLQQSNGHWMWDFKNVKWVWIED